MEDTYRTLESPSEGIYKEKMSRFLSFAHPVCSEEEVKRILEEYRKMYYDARHICWAYQLGPRGERFRANDNGEPSGTAGKPILGQIRSAGLTDLLVVVVRYFGGIKLGTGGLIVAYREAAAEAIQAGHIVERLVEEEMRISFEYPYLNEVMRIVKEMNVTVLTQQFELSCEMLLRIRLAQAETLRIRLGKVSSLQFVVDTEQAEID